MASLINVAGTSRRVLVGKIDLDTVGTAWLLGVTRQDQVEVVRGEASQEDLADPSVLCIEVGGSGRVDEGNFDHHAPDGPAASATAQAADRVYPVGVCLHGYLDCSCCEQSAGRPFGWGWVERMVDYINLLDTRGPEALRARTGGNVAFPTLSDVFAGLLLSERDPVEQLHKGVELLAKVVETVPNPFGTIPGFDAYAEAKAANNAAIAKAVESAQWGFTRAGHKLAYLETDFFGAPGALYGRGAEVVVAYSPHFGNPPVPKFTVAGNGVKVDSALQALGALEEGWGGPPTGTIIGSPRSGSKLTLVQVVRIVSETC